MRLQCSVFPVTGKQRDMARPVERWSPTPLAEAFAIGGAADAGGQIKRRSNVMASCLQKREPVCQLAAALNVFEDMLI